ncbi:hypothetical protein YC2023_083135 [Brassica napus]
MDQSEWFPFNAGMMVTLYVIIDDTRYSSSSLWALAPTHTSNVNGRGFLSADKIPVTAEQSATVSTNVLKLKHDGLNYGISKRNRSEQIPSQERTDSNKKSFYEFYAIQVPLPLGDPLSPPPDPSPPQCAETASQNASSSESPHSNISELQGLMYGS